MPYMSRFICYLLSHKEREIQVEKANNYSYREAFIDCATHIAGRVNRRSLRGDKAITYHGIMSHYGYTSTRDLFHQVLHLLSIIPVASRSWTYQYQSNEKEGKEERNMG